MPLARRRDLTGWLRAKLSMERVVSTAGAEGLGEEAAGLVESGDASATGEDSGFFFDFLDFFSGEGVDLPV